MAAADRRCRSTPQTNQHRRAAENNERSPHHDLFLLDILASHAAQAAGNHDGLVVTANRARNPGLRALLFEHAEIAASVRTAKFIIKGGRADGCSDHDVECRGDTIGFAEIDFPGLRHSGNFEIGYREAGESGLRFRTDAGRTLVANLASRSRGRAGKR